MANTKISALTAATTPLAGTEVLPIVQSSTTKQVSVADLTAGRSVSAASLSLTTTPLVATSGGTGQSSYAVGDLLYASTTTVLSKLADVATGNALISGGVGVAPSWGKIGLTTHVSGTLAVSNGGTGAATLTGYVYGNGTSAMTASTTIPTTALSGSSISLSNSSGNSYFYALSTNNSSAAYFRSTANTAGGVANTWYVGQNLSTNTGTFEIYDGTLAGRILSSVPGSGNVTLEAGNLVQGTASKGINFTANTPAAGKTSQLLNWYEEGTWTPTVTANVGTILTLGTLTGSYTRIGRQVMVMFDCTITLNGTGSSYIKVAGLPFASVTYVASGAGKEYNVTDKSLNLVLAAGSTTIGVFFYDGTYPGGNNYRLLGTLTYFV